MSKINMDTVRLLVNDEFYKCSNADKNTICDAIDYLMENIKIDNKYLEKLKSLDISLESYIVEGVVKYMAENEYSADDFWNHEDYSEVIERIHEY